MCINLCSVVFNSPFQAQQSSHYSRKKRCNPSLSSCTAWGWWMLHIWISFQLSSSRSEPDVAHRLHINPRRRWNSTAHSGIPCVFPSQRLTQTGRTTLLTFVIWSEGEEEDDNAHQQDNHQHHRCQEDGSARRPSHQPTQSLTHTAGSVAIPRGWAGKPDV